MDDGGESFTTGWGQGSAGGALKVGNIRIDVKKSFTGCNYDCLNSSQAQLEINNDLEQVITH